CRGAAINRARSAFHPEKPRGGAPEDHLTVAIAEPEALHRLHRALEAHVETVIASEEHAVGPDLADEVRVDAIVVADGIVGEAAQVCARPLLEVRELGAHGGA